MYSWVSYLCTTRARQGKMALFYETIWAVAHFSICVIFHQFVCSDKKQFVALPGCMSNRAECDPIPKITLGV